MWPLVLLISGLCSLPQQSSGFWWPKPTTETPRGQLMHQIPLTYFRTYTYQPLTGGPFGVPLFGFGAAQTPLLSGSHYDPYAVNSYAAVRRHDTGAALGYKTDAAPPAMSSSGSSSSSGSGSGSGSGSVSSTMAAPTTSTTSTTTTTTTPAPTTTTTTTTTTTSAPPPSSTTDASLALRYAEYPTYSRRVNNVYNPRPQYPYPDYFNYQPQSTLPEKGGTRIQFVPCMCPVSMSGISNLAGVSSSSSSSSSTSGNSASSSGSGSSTDRDRPLGGVTISSSLPVSNAIGAAELAPAERNVVALQSRHMDDDDQAELETDMEDVDESDASVETDEVAAKLVSEPQLTTPVVDLNSLL